MQSSKQRKKSRKYAMQALYSWQMSGTNIGDIKDFYLADRNPGKFDVEYFEMLLHQIPNKVAELDESLAPYISREIKEIDPIELSILRIAAYEFQYRLEVPFKVVINEALDLAKTFGGEDSFRFVNSALDKMAKNYRETENLQQAYV